jgi:NADH-quinone oxidoreductase subunit L
MIQQYLWLIPALPFFASVLIAFLGYRVFKEYSHWPCILAAGTSCVLSICVFSSINEKTRVLESPSYSWISVNREASPGKIVSDFDGSFRFRADALTAIMLVTVTFISTFIAIYASGYMHGDPGYPRFFAEISLFIASMTGLVLADNFLLLYGFWEGVGLCSYLLIGFWFAKPSAAAAARKAFLVTRLGDIGLILGILLLWRYFGTVGSYDFRYETLFETARARQAEYPGVLALACLLLFCGAVGKSAQFPLHVWLPDAMEGPTPVSALIHAATMVTAGVYLVARCMPIFHLVPQVLLVVASIGTFTAFMAAIIALTQNDLKRVLAYSTVSQLGYMFMALGSGVTEELMGIAVMAAIFHLFTHAFFKALLFLSAGSVMHAMGNVIDMRRFSGLRRVLPQTHWTFLCGALALSGFPFFSGFWSKDVILGTSLEASHTGRSIYMLLFIGGLVTAGLTAFYTFRGYFLTFWGEERIPPEAGHHAHESPPQMTVPLMVLAMGATFAGIIVGPTNIFADFIGLTPNIGEITEHANIPMMAGSALVALTGIFVAWWMYVREPGTADKLVRGAQGLYQLSLNKLYLDELYDLFIVKPAVAFAVICRVFDLYILDGLVDFIGHVPRLAGLLFRPIQNGLVQFYALAMVLGMTVFLIALMRALGG